MSVSAYLEVKLSHPQIKKMSSVELIQRLLNQGWALNYDGEVSYLPLGDNDEFAWRAESISSESLLAILNEKEQRGELVGVVLTWKDSGIGGDFLVYNDGTLSVSLSINRKLIEDVESGITDLNWYLVKLLPVFSGDGLQVESFSYEEHL